MTGTVVETASLGLPQLPQTGNPTSMASLLTGSHTMKVYYQDSKHYRLSIPQPQSETDVIANGSKLWLWQSSSDSVTEFTQADQASAKNAAPKVAQTPLTPQQAANQVLAKVGKTTLVSVQANVMVAGEPSYQLVLAPKDSRSLVGKVMIAIDGKYGVPLRVQLYAKGASSPAFQVGYTALQWVAPDPANFSFTPPKGASVDVVNPKNEAKSASGSTPSNAPASAATARAGSPWSRSRKRTSCKDSERSAGSSGSASSSNGQQNIASNSNQGVGVSSQELINALLGTAKPVHGSWGSGTLVTTSLVSMLMTGGEVYIGAVQPTVLYAAVGHTTS